MFACSVCGAGESREERAEEVFRIDGNYVLVGRIPATVCTRCGEETFSRETTEKIRLMVHGQTSPTKSIPLKVFEFGIACRRTPRNHSLERKGRTIMASLFAGTENMEDIEKIYNKLEANYPHPSSTSKALWKLRRATDISGHSPNKETMLEKAVALLADNNHMPEWFNQCPAASGITDSSRDRKTSVDLVHWDASNQRARLVELKWESDDPIYALREILRYGAAYVFCRIHKSELPLEGRDLMDACHVSLEVVAPARYYRGCSLAGALARMSQHLKVFDVGSRRIPGLTMSLDALAFPDDFNRLPFANGAEVTQKCGAGPLTPEGRQIHDAFAGLTPAA